MRSKNDKHNVEQRIANCLGLIHSLEAGAKMISYIVCRWDRLCKTELHFRSV